MTVSNGLTTVGQCWLSRTQKRSSSAERRQGWKSM